MPVETTNPVKATANPNSVSARIIAAGIVIAFCYWASTVLVTLVVAVLMAYFLDPVVNWLEEWHVPRALGALIVVLSTICLMLLLAWTLILRFDQFGQDWPNYQKPLKTVASAVSKKLETFESHVSEIEPAEKPGERIIAVADSHPVRNAVLSRLGALEAVFVAATFVPFLLFFMLAAKRQVWHATMQLFPTTERTRVKQTLGEVTLVLRSYVIGTALVGLILVFASWMFFMSIGLEFPFLAALVSGSVNLIPYFGVVLCVVSARDHWTQTVQACGAFHRHRRDDDGAPPDCGKLADARAGRLARAPQCTGAHGGAAVLGLAMGADGPDSRGSNHRCD